MSTLSFAPPKGYVVPEGTKPGDTFQELCSFKLEGDKVCLTKMGDVDTGYKETEGSKPDYSNYVDSMQQQPATDDQGET